MFKSITKYKKIDFFNKIKEFDKELDKIQYLKNKSENTENLSYITYNKKNLVFYKSFERETKKKSKFSKVVYSLLNKKFQM